MRSSLDQQGDVQPSLGDFQTTAEEAAETKAAHLWRAQLWTAMRTFAAAYIGPDGTKGVAACADALNRQWKEDGRPVTEASLGAALRDSERNHFRLEWVDWFANRSPEIADLLARRVKPTKTTEQLLEDLMEVVRKENPRRAEALFREARAL